eukprot:RCo015976
MRVLACVCGGGALGEGGGGEDGTLLSRAHGLDTAPWQVKRAAHHEVRPVGVTVGEDLGGAGRDADQLELLLQREGIEGLVAPGLPNQQHQLVGQRHALLLRHRPGLLADGIEGVLGELSAGLHDVPRADHCALGHHTALRNHGARTYIRLVLDGAGPNCDARLDHHAGADGHPHALLHQRCSDHRTLLDVSAGAHLDGALLPTNHRVVPNRASGFHGDVPDHRRGGGKKDRAGYRGLGPQEWVHPARALQAVVLWGQEASEVVEVLPHAHHAAAQGLRQEGCRHRRTGEEEGGKHGGRVGVGGRARRQPKPDQKAGGRRREVEEKRGHEKMIT